MLNPQLSEVVEYVKKARQAKQPDEQTKQILAKNGWSGAEISEAFTIAGVAIIQQQKPQPQAQPAQQTQTQPQQPLQQKTQFQPQQVQPQIQNQPVQPQSRPQPQYAAVETKQFRARSGNRSVLKLIIALIILLVVVSLAGGGIALATKIWTPSWSPFLPSPESVILKAWNNLKENKTENFVLDLLLFTEDAITDEGAPVGFSFNLKADAGINNSDLNNRLVDLNASLDASRSGDNFQNLSFGAKAKIIGGDLYINVHDVNLESAEPVENYISDIALIDGQWIKFAEDQKPLQDVLNQIFQTLLNAKAYDIKKLADNQGKEGSEYHYLISLNKEKLNGTLPDILNINELNVLLDKIREVSFELFIGKEDEYFHKVQISKELDLGKIDSRTTGKLLVSFLLEKATIKTPVDIQAPESFKTYEEVIVPSRKAVAIRNNVSGISRIATDYYRTAKSFANFCRAGYLNGYLPNYGKALADYSKDIVAQGGNWPNCFSNARNYCVSVLMADKSWLCISNNGEGSVRCTSSLTVCK